MHICCSAWTVYEWRQAWTPLWNFQAFKYDICRVRLLHSTFNNLPSQKFTDMITLPKRKSGLYVSRLNILKRSPKGWLITPHQQKKVSIMLESLIQTHSKYSKFWHDIGCSSKQNLHVVHFVVISGIHLQYYCLYSYCSSENYRVELGSS